MDNLNNSKEVPEEIKRWNWGAFMLNILWGIGNKSYLPLLCLVPLLNIVWIFVCGVKGNEWAWKKGEYSNVEDFMKTQATWNRAGIAFFVSVILLWVFYILIGISLFTKMLIEYGIS